MHLLSLPNKNPGVGCPIRQGGGAGGYGRDEDGKGTGGAQAIGWVVAAGRCAGYGRPACGGAVCGQWLVAIPKKPLESEKAKGTRWGSTHGEIRWVAERRKVDREGVG